MRGGYSGRATSIKLLFWRDFGEDEENLSTEMQLVDQLARERPAGLLVHDAAMVWKRNSTMRHRVLWTVSFAALALAGCKKEAPAANDTATTAAATTVAPDMVPGMDTTAAADTQSPAQAFADTAAASDAFEIETSKLAVANGQSDAVKRFATKMIDAHTQSTEKLKLAAGKLSPSITPDADLTDAQEQKLDALKDLKGADFDKAYAAAQVEGHQKTLDALKAFAASGDAPAPLKDFAKTLIPTVTAHLNMAKAL